jgi:PRC-barrel domain protein
MAESGHARRPGRMPTLEEARRWIGYRVDEVGGTGVARVRSVYVDQESGEPVWLLVKLGRFGKPTVIPLSEAAAVARTVWVAYPRELIRHAPTVDDGDPLTREQELELCAHYGIVGDRGRAGALAGRPQGAVTSQAPAVIDDLVG